MIISESWLREWVSPKLSTDELAELLTQAGLEVETVIPQPTLGDKVVVGRIIGIEKHPDADKLNVCRVDVGLQQALTIVCGASNARENLVAPVALVGASLPNGMDIGAREVRGIASTGMICAAAELGLDDQSDGLMELDKNAPIGLPVDEYLGLEDVSIDVDLTPDRGDCLSIAGVARDVAALSRVAVTPLESKTIIPTIDDVLSVKLEAPAACPRYAGRAIRGVDLNAQTPDVMKEKLRRVGVRSISPIVDVTNYVMLELGQPMHAFDFDKIDGGIVVRMAKATESLTLLDGQEITLQDDMLVIADFQKPVALAGIMGGGNSEIDENTTDIFLESAYFSPLVIAGKARSLGLQTDASHRFERGVDTHLQVVAIERATELLLDIVGGQAGPVVDVVNEAHMPAIETIDLRPQRVRDMLGLEVTDATIKQHFVDLQMQVNDTSLPWVVTRPSWRFDVTGEHDLVEEIGRLEGLDKIEPKAPQLSAKPHAEKESSVSGYTLKSRLADQAYREVVSYSFIDPADQLPGINSVFGDSVAIDLANPIASNMSQMRQSILPGLLNTARANEQRQHSRIRLFEMGHTFSANSQSDTGVHEQSRLALLAGGEQNSTYWVGHGRKTDFYDLKGDLDKLFDRAGLLPRVEYVSNADIEALHPGQASTIFLDAEAIG
ncbi:MAG: phenylalanine--tRNA ligase subunit beta, partial [Proteobacteria bacterium]|nr:phenylalanine--tRNA ligase subunit beta [Pseudomonadota bacterium]